MTKPAAPPKALSRIADLAHEGHDRFRPEHCAREVCREIARLIGTRP